MARYNDRITFHIALFQPEIPQNTGNIGRLCLGGNAILHLIRPIRFLIDDKNLKRAGLDYWDKLRLEIHDSFESFIEKFKEHRIFYLTTKSRNIYSNYDFSENDVFVFGPETRGLPESMLNSNKDRCLTIPMSDSVRSINLSNSVAIILYEALRQQNFNLKEDLC